jgi:hypothetical protein
VSPVALSALVDEADTARGLVLDEVGLVLDHV